MPASFSLATDLGNGFPLAEALRNTLLAVRLAEHLGLAGQMLSDAFYVAMLRYIGCTALDYEMGSSYVAEFFDMAHSMPGNAYSAVWVG